jgi:polyisoprenoid-binding protein YceI
MRKSFGVLLSVVGFAWAQAAFAAEYAIDQAHSHVGFSIRHIATKVKGEFRDFSGSFSFDEKNPAASKVSVTVQAASVFTNNDKRDAHLRTPDFFDATKYPTATFKSTKVETAGKGHYKVTGDLTLHGVTKSVVLDVEHLGTEQAFGTAVAGFTATTKILRKDFGFDLGKVLESGKLMLSDEVDLALEIEAKAKK